MEARIACAAILVASFFSLGASSRTQNFIVTADQPQHAEQIAQAAESFRRDLAIKWLGAELPPWQSPCPISVQVGRRLGAGGATSFMFENGRPFGWTMSIQGSYERVLDSVLPHEVTHTIFATHFGRPLPRWADEGSCTTVEHQSERQKQQDLLLQFLTSSPSRGIAFNRMFTMTEYPSDVIPLYSQGHSVSRYLIAQGGERKFMQYLADGMSNDSFDPRTNTITNPKQALACWTAATKSHYGYENLSNLQLAWLDWVRKGRPPIQARPTELLANTTATNSDAQSPNGARPAKSIYAVSATGANTASQQGLTPVGPPPARSLPANEPLEGGLAAMTSAGNQPYRPGSIREAPPLSQTLSRPQPIGRPEQIILDSGTPAAANGAATAARTLGVSPPASRYSAQPDATMLR